jgi:hypothetical protein
MLGKYPMRKTSVEDSVVCVCVLPEIEIKLAATTIEIIAPAIPNFAIGFIV